MKILVLCDVLFPDTIGGAGRVAYHHGHELAKKGNEVFYITRNTGNLLPAEEHPHPGMHIYRFPFPNGNIALSIISELRESFSLTRSILQKHTFDLVCVHQSMPAIAPLYGKCLKRLPVIYFFHSPWHEEFTIKKSTPGQGSNLIKTAIAGFMRFAEKQVINKSSKVIVLSSFMRSKLRELHKADSGKIEIIHGGVDLDHFSTFKTTKKNARKITNWPSGKIIFLTVRNLVQRMGIENLIEAFKNSPDLRKNSLLYIGGKGPLENRLKSLVQKYSLEETIRFTGRIPDNDLPICYRAADYFVLPTQELEGFGLVIPEAMACGTPVIGTPAGAIPEITGAFDPRLLTKGTSSEDLKAKLEEIVKNRQNYRFTALKCRKFAEENYSWEKMANDFQKTALKIIRKP